MAERLRGETSPYLLQHADNPVDWWPWSDAAFAAAAERDVPVLLSVGYSACHWCHVMAHESFEDVETAALMNQFLVSIKVDREERPDVDSVYMMATQAMTGQGGWPMTVFLTPGREPFFCGTYFPRAQFQRLVLGVAQAWQEDKDHVTNRARQIASALAERADAATARPVPGAPVVEAPVAEAPVVENTVVENTVVENTVAKNTEAEAGPTAGAETVEGAELDAACRDAVAELALEFDAGRGGFGGAPKFPPSMVLEFLLRHAERTAGGDGERALAMAQVTASAMASGGMYDQLAGGFARYSTDADWVVPHFEKMLYDNALLARVYAHLWRRTGNALARRVAEETCDFMIAELRTPEGGFAAALDADSDGVEGAYYVWTPAELRQALGDEDGGYAAAVFGVTQAGTFEHGASVLQLRSEPPDPDRFASVRARLLAARGRRNRPGLDGKVVAAWNGLAIAALAEAGLLLDRPDFIAAATAAADLLTSVHLSGSRLTSGRLTRTSSGGRASGTAGVLEDYGCVAAGLIALATVTEADPENSEAEGGEAGNGQPGNGQPGNGGPGPARWLAIAGELLDTVVAHFGTGTGGFYDTADDAERLIYRPSDVADGPTPSGTFAVADALLSYAALTGVHACREAAVEALASVPSLAARYPRAAGWGLAVAEALLSGPAEIAIAGPPGPRRAELHRTALHAAPPGAVIAVGDGDGQHAQVPLLAGRTPVGGRPAAYVCRNFTCRAPVTEPAELRAELG